MVANKDNAVEMSRSTQYLSHGDNSSPRREVKEAQEKEIGLHHIYYLYASHILIVKLNVIIVDSLATILWQF